MLWFASGAAIATVREPSPQSSAGPAPAHIQSKDIGYRPDIDGLRALAVIPVVLFHAGVPYLNGGFVGVDVFFVISGYLITLLLLAEIKRGRFSIASFYRRRARRILPALTALLACVTAAALVLYSPAMLEAYGVRLIGASFFSANIQFLLESGYFAPTARELELLHLWSLAVEEQFYLLFPLLLWAGMRLAPGKGVAGLIVALLLVSLAASVAVTNYDPAIAFYLLPTRAWELLIGATLAIRIVPSAGSRASSALGLLGLGLLIASVVLISDTTPFPGIAALMPCAGAALIIHAGEGSARCIATRLLAAKPLVAVGLVSYSLYLWHWPLLAMPTQYLGRNLVPVERFAAVTAALLLSVLSWKFIELPFRAGRGKRQAPKRPLTVAAITIAACAMLGGLLIASNGLPARVPAELVALERSAAEARRDLDQADEQTCGTDHSQDAACRGPGAQVILWGDSHAVQYAAALREQVQGLVRYGGPGCPPLLDVVPVKTPPNLPFSPAPGTRKKGLKCLKINREAIASITSTPGVQVVVLGGAWQFYSEGIDPRTGERRYLTWNGRPPFGVEASRGILAASLTRTVDALRDRGIAVLILADVPATNESPVRCLGRSLMFKAVTGDCAIPAEQVRRNLNFSNRLIASLSARSGVYAFYPARYLCDSRRCPALRNGALLYLDNDHITPAAARFLVPSMRIGSRRLSDFTLPQLPNP